MMIIDWFAGNGPIGGVIIGWALELETPPDDRKVGRFLLFTLSSDPEPAQLLSERKPNRQLHVVTELNILKLNLIVMW